MKAILALEDGRIFKCSSFTGAGEASGEIVFNTGMTGYQEILTDPSYKNQMVAMTYPLIGNYGTNNEDVESDHIQVSAFLIREYQNYPSNYRSTASLAEYLSNSGNSKSGIFGIENLDTRALTRHIRNAGAMRAFISTEDLDPLSCVQKAKEIPPMAGQDFVKEVTTGFIYRWAGGQKIAVPEQDVTINGKLWKNSNGKKRIVLFDYGVKFNILRCLELAGCDLIVVPAVTAADVVKAMEPDGIFLSNGPGDPEPVTYAINTIKQLIGYRPIFGICLGLQIMGLALGGKTFKLKFGHRGANQPVKNLITKKIEITSQNHGFALNPESFNNPDIEITHINLNDNTVEGFKHKKLPLQAVQYHPEASPGPHDAGYFFNDFVTKIEN